MTTDTFTVSGTWQCPANVYYVDVKLRGGGGGGGAGGGDVHYTCNGGSAGQLVEHNLVEVTPGYYYDIHIGDGGGIKNYASVGNVGGATTGFGYTANGGAGGLQIQFGDPNGGAGGAPTGGGAGGNSTLGTGGAASGGGGGAGGATYNIITGQYETVNSAAGGKGAASVTYTLPTVDFIGTPLSGQLPVTTTWTNTTTDGVTYYWDFGNGTNSTNENPTPTVYNTPSNFTVTLTATNTYGFAQKVRADYVKVHRPPYNCLFLIVSDNIRGV